MYRQKPIPFFERYLISNDGIVTNSKTGRQLKPELISKGYYSVTLSNKTKHRREYIHRLVGQAFVENPYNKPFINHKNGIRIDNRSENLEWVTPKENIRHAYRIGLCPTKLKALQGGKLTEEQVLEIRDLIKKGVPPIRLSKIYNMHPVSISNINRRVTWKHLK